MWFPSNACIPPSRVIPQCEMFPFLHESFFHSAFWPSPTRGFAGRSPCPCVFSKRPHYRPRPNHRLPPPPPPSLPPGLQRGVPGHAGVLHCGHRPLRPRRPGRRGPRGGGWPPPRADPRWPPSLKPDKHPRLALLPTRSPPSPWPPPATELGHNHGTPLQALLRRVRRPRGGPGPPLPSPLRPAAACLGVALWFRLALLDRLRWAWVLLCLLATATTLACWICWNIRNEDPACCAPLPPPPDSIGWAPVFQVAHAACTSTSVMWRLSRRSKGLQFEPGPCDTTGDRAHACKTQDRGFSVCVQASGDRSV